MGKFTWHGADLLKAIADETPEALYEGAQLLADVAASKAPRRSGDLANSAYAAGGGKSSYKSGKTYRKELTPPEGGAVMAFASFYARFIELGTRKRAAHPFVRPALDELQLGARIVDRLRGKVNK